MIKCARPERKWSICCEEKGHVYIESTCIAASRCIYGKGKYTLWSLSFASTIIDSRNQLTDVRQKFPTIISRPLPAARVIQPPDSAPPVYVTFLASIAILHTVYLKFTSAIMLRCKRSSTLGMGTSSSDRACSSVSLPITPRTAVPSLYEMMLQTDPRRSLLASSQIIV